MLLRIVFIFFFLIGTSGVQAQNVSPNAPPAPEDVTIEVNAVRIILNDEHRNGVDWGAIVSDFHTAPLKNPSDPDWNDQKYRLSFGTLSQDDYQVLLDALDMAGKVSQFPQSPVKTTLGTPVKINFQEQNARVDVLLARLKSGDISLHLDPHFTIATTEFWDGRKFPSSITLQSDTKMILQNNATIVIGGFMKEEEIRRTHKFPVLGSIPIVGLVFRSKGRLVQKTETVIFLTIHSHAVETSDEDGGT
jgi:hypothetical protein